MLEQLIPIITLAFYFFRSARRSIIEEMETETVAAETIAWRRVKAISWNRMSEQLKGFIPIITLAFYFFRGAKWPIIGDMKMQTVAGGEHCRASFEGIRKKRVILGSSLQTHFRSRQSGPDSGFRRFY
jgi:hypothetical protein